jgi:thiosulfate dehydrogenase
MTQSKFGDRLRRTVLPAVLAILAGSACAADWPGFSKHFDALEVPAGELGDSINHGRDLVDNTARLLPLNVGNPLNCTSCHQDGGQKPYAGPFVGLAGVFPEYSQRDQHVITLQDRINDCFMRSMNGKPIPSDSQDMNDFVAYMTYLSREVPTGKSVEGRGFKAVAQPAQPFSPIRGKDVYEAICSDCHGANGEGKDKYPPLWGAGSYNDGAGMAKVEKAVKFIKWNMPKRDPGTLTDQEAWDVAAYIDSQPRPHFVQK